MRNASIGSRWKLGAITGFTWVLLLLQGQPGWPKDALFQAMGIVHDGRQTPAPDFSLPTPEGKTVALTQLRGKVVFLNFWATWCPPCRVEMPSMERLYKEFKDQGLVILAIDMGESPKLVSRFMSEFRLSFPALLDVDMRVAALYRVRGIPATFLIDRNGRMVGAAVGPRDWASPEAKALIRLLLEQQGKQGS